MGAAVKGSSEESFGWWKCSVSWPSRKCIKVNILLWYYINVLQEVTFEEKQLQGHGISLYYCLKLHVNYLKIKSWIKTKKATGSMNMNPDRSTKETASAWTWPLHVSRIFIYWPFLALAFHPWFMSPGNITNFIQWRRGTLQPCQDQLFPWWHSK